MNTIRKNMAIATVALVAMNNAIIEVNAEQPRAIGIAIKTLNIRQGASSKEKLIMKAPVGSEIEILSLEDKKGWAKVRYKNKEGWGYMPNVKEKKMYSSARYISGAHRLHLREKATSKSNSLGYIYEGEKVEVIDYTGSYARIKYKDKVYYTLKAYLVEKDPKHIKYISGVWRKVLKSGYLSTSKTMGYVYEGEKITVLGYREGHAHILYGGKRYYIKNSYLVAKNPVKYKYVDLEERIPVFSGSNNITGYLGRGQKVKVFSEKNGDIRISYQGKTGFLKGDKFLSDYESKVIDGVDIISVYENFDKKKVIDKLYDGMIVSVISENKGMSKIRYGEKEGYIESSYLKRVKYIEGSKEVALKTNTNVSENNILCYIVKGEKVEVLDYEDKFAKVKYKDYIGYVQNEYLVLGKSGSNKGFIQGLKADSLNSELRYTKKDNVKVYKNPLVNDSLHGYLPKGSAVGFVNHLNNEYTKVTVNGGIVGYVKREDLSHRNTSMKTTSRVTTKKLDSTHKEYLKTQEGKPYVRYEDVEYYSNPLNFSIENSEHKYQFLKLNTFRNVNAYDLNVYLSNLNVNKGNEAIFNGQADAFINAAKKYNIDPIYLVAHTLLETGSGNSKLAQGVIVTVDAAGNKVPPTKVYNLFGIGAVDSDAIGMGSKTAYALGWTSIPKAIEGAAKWISEGVPANASVGLKKSYGYINSTKFPYQYNLYAMRWDYINGWHQYATDPQWALKISRLMSRLSYIYEGACLEFEIPEYKKEKLANLIDLFIKEDEIDQIEEVDVDDGNDITEQTEEVDVDDGNDMTEQTEEVDVDDGNDMTEQTEEVDVDEITIDEEILD